ncbi:MAG: uncharacterized protein KVP18_000787 [Porospora cf. gigantea A]|uniref:uncharacterized protein n=1 Tax=Porospora cf. gigantea A TaxID=2853593 RepID=UPI003559F1BB|nr:MAG: hypothetical protein KVP18_000787 [Porospora cf. gigantea A]
MTTISAVDGSMFHSSSGVNKRTGNTLTLHVAGNFSAVASCPNGVLLGDEDGMLSFASDTTNELHQFDAAVVSISLLVDDMLSAWLILLEDGSVHRLGITFEGTVQVATSMEVLPSEVTPRIPNSMCVLRVSAELTVVAISESSERALTVLEVSDSGQLLNTARHAEMFRKADPTPTWRLACWFLSRYLLVLPGHSKPRVLDLTTGRLTFVTSPHTNPVAGVHAYEDTVVTSGLGNEFVVWRVEGSNFTPLTPLIQSREAATVVVEDGHYLVVTDTTAKAEPLLAGPKQLDPGDPHPRRRLKQDSESPRDFVADTADVVDESPAVESPARQSDLFADTSGDLEALWREVSRLQDRDAHPSVVQSQQPVMQLKRGWKHTSVGETPWTVAKDGVEWKKLLCYSVDGALMMSVELDEEDVFRVSRMITDCYGPSGELAEGASLPDYFCGNLTPPAVENYLRPKAVIRVQSFLAENSHRNRSFTSDSPVILGAIGRFGFALLCQEAGCRSLRYHPFDSWHSVEDSKWRVEFSLSVGFLALAVHASGVAVATDDHQILLYHRFGGGIYCAWRIPGKLAFLVSRENLILAVSCSMQSPNEHAFMTLLHQNLRRLSTCDIGTDQHEAAVGDMLKLTDDLIESQEPDSVYCVHMLDVHPSRLQVLHQKTLAVPFLDQLVWAGISGLGSPTVVTRAGDVLCLAPTAGRYNKVPQAALSYPGTPYVEDNVWDESGVGYLWTPLLDFHDDRRLRAPVRRLRTTLSAYLRQPLLYGVDYNLTRVHLLEDRWLVSEPLTAVLDFLTVYHPVEVDNTGILLTRFKKASSPGYVHSFDAFAQSLAHMPFRPPTHPMSTSMDIKFKYHFWTEHVAAASGALGYLQLKNPSSSALPRRLMESLWRVNRLISNQLDTTALHAGLLECFTASTKGRLSMDFDSVRQIQSRLSSELERTKFVLFAQALTTQQYEASYRDAHDFITPKALGIALRKIEKENHVGLRAVSHSPCSIESSVGWRTHRKRCCLPSKRRSSRRVKWRRQGQ